jgi:hypothetical protein
MTDIGPGTRVECIKDGWIDYDGRSPDMPSPSRGGLYTVENVTKCDCGCGEAFFILKGFRWEWFAECFRPIGGTETGMKMIREAMKTKELVEGV